MQLRCRLGRADVRGRRVRTGVRQWRVYRSKCMFMHSRLAGADLRGGDLRPRMRQRDLLGAEHVRLRPGLDGQ